MGDRSRLVELKRELEWRKCSKDPIYFFENYWHIAHPEHGRILFKLWAAQKRGIRHWMENRYSLTLKARQLGWSTSVAAYAFWLAFFHPDKNIIMISRTEREALSLLRKTKYGYKYLPAWMRERGPKTVIEHQQKLEFDNASKVTSMPSASDPARGEAASLVIVDEWAFLPNAEDAWASIEPVADVGGRIIGLSTANGWGDFFHRLWVGATTKSGVGAQFKEFFVPWYGNEQRDQAWYEAKKASMLPWQLAQEYPESPEEAFVKSGRNVFDVDDLRDKVRPIEPVKGELYPLGTAPQNYEWRPVHLWQTGDDRLEVWREPHPDGVYVVGADTSEGLEWGDYSSAHVINAVDGEVVAHWHGHVPADQFAHELYRLGAWYNLALMGPEANNHGLTTITELRRLGYKRIFRRRAVNNAKAGRSPQLQFGWATNKTTKPLMIDELAKALREGAITLYDQETLAELMTYVRDDMGRMGGSPFDDRVISLAIAVQMLEYVFLPEYRPDDSAQWGTLNWWAQVQPDQWDPRQSDRWVIGQHAGRKR